MSATARIHGTYEYDDDLTPGKKKEGGLHQNLYDGEGNLKGNARFIPDDDQPQEDHGSVYVDPYDAAQLAAEAEAEERQRERERQENFELIVTVLKILVVAYPHVQRLWRAKLSPAVQARRDAHARGKIERQARREQKRATDRNETTEVATRVENGIAKGVVITPTNDLLIAFQEYLRNMSSSEAQARYLMALAARAFSDEQLRTVANADIVEDEHLVELESAFAELPPARVARLIDQLELNSSVLGDETFDLVKFFARVAERMPLDELREPRCDG